MFILEFFLYHPSLLLQLTVYKLCLLHCCLFWSLIGWDYLALNNLGSLHLWMSRLEALLEPCTALGKCSFQWELGQMSSLSSPVQVIATCFIWSGPTGALHVLQAVSVGMKWGTFLHPVSLNMFYGCSALAVQGFFSGFWLVYCFKNSRSKLSNPCLGESSF